VRLSPLQLLEYTFDGITVLPVKGYVADPKVSPSLVFFPGKLDLSAETGLSLLKEEKNYSDFEVSLTLRAGPREPESAPYKIQMSVRGLVRMHLTLAKDQAEERRARALVNGVSLLFGAAREMIITVTSRSVYGSFLLPSLNFSDLASLPAAAPVRPTKSRSKSNAVKMDKVRPAKARLK
jgi:preprotein translocase subunit SecB